MGAAKIAGLLDLKVLGHSEEVVRAQVLPIARQHQLLSPYTSFIAIQEIVSLPPGARGQRAGAQYPPAGPGSANLRLSPHGHHGPCKGLVWAVALFAATLVRAMRQPELDHVPPGRE